MGQPAAKQGDQIVATDIHIVLVPAPPAPPVPTPLPHPFVGLINGNLSGNVNMMGRAAATVDSTADNTPPHLPTPPGIAFQNPPQNKATIKLGSATVKINGKMAARNGDIAETCNDPAAMPVGQVIAVGTVMVGG
ncbi:PAAR domain-containing protein [Nodosilinea sp. PGN35]|uniref:PAAR domain-containing protein n=1 Tax=Nodosilinea sp. PGN35 TaxID=3020489 RepID=UPI0023B21761|nr:PAAR domain-containing protein [Nodosilinea sp. TSF1-S3]MDF0367884.1 hypothetical protein [Nodosilinea sp. TSF1-S3]